MATGSFTVGTTITTTDNFVDVITATGAAPIAPGTHHFQLVVVDEAGNKSAPVTATVVIRDTALPTAVLTIAPTQVQPGQTFRLDGSRSTDVAPGTIAQFVWTLID